MDFTHVNAGQEAELMVACEQADAIVAMTYRGQEELLALGVPRAKIVVASSGRGGFQPRRRVIGIVGDEQPNGRKRSSLLLDLAWQTDLSPFAFLIVGKGWEPVAMKLRIMGIAVEIKTDLSHEELQAAYHRMDVFLVTAYREGGPLPLLEALAAGVPVIAPSVGYMADLRRASQQDSTASGLWRQGWLRLYSSEDVRSLTAALDEVVAPARFFAQLVGTYSVGAWVEDHLRLFERVLGRELPPLEGEARRYRQLSAIIDEIKPRRLLEVGACRGERALQMIGDCLRYHEAGDISYWGFDLFEHATPQLLAKEFSSEKPPLPRAVVEARLRATGAYINLIQGDTRETLAKHRVPADLFFVDGGHSWETIAADWKALEPCVYDGAVVVFDDCYTPQSSGLPSGVGSQKLIGELLDTGLWEIEPLAVEDTFQKEWGTLAIRMVKVKRRAKLAVSGSGEVDTTTIRVPTSVMGTSPW